MSSVKQFAGCVLAGALASVSFSPDADASVSVQVNDNAPLAVQTPTTAPSGIVYQQNNGQTSLISVFTEGFLFCANVPQAPSSVTTLAPQHEDQSFSPAHPWNMPSASDVLAVSYTGSLLSINRSRNGVLPSTLACRSTGKFGDAPTGLTEGIFGNGVDAATTINYSHLVNWVAPPGFDWTVRDNWDQVPADGCATLDAAQVAEDVGCASIHGVGTDSKSLPVRTGTMLTAADATSFTYLFRVDARFGAQSVRSPSQFQLPMEADEAADSPLAMYFTVRDAFDSSYLSPTASASYCLIADPALPAALGSGTCASAGAVVRSTSGPLELRLAVFAPPVSSGVTSFYVVVNRPIGQGSHPSESTPVVAAAVLVDPVVVAEGADRFSGDDIAFGFMPGATSGFPWMNGQ